MQETLGTSMRETLSTVLQVNAILLRPFRQQVNLTDALLVLALLLVVSGMWHLVLQRVEL